MYSKQNDFDEIDNPFVLVLIPLPKQILELERYYRVNSQRRRSSRRIVLNSQSGIEIEQFNRKSDYLSSHKRGNSNRLQDVERLNRLRFPPKETPSSL